MDKLNLNITIIGLGLIGGSYAMAIKKRLNPKNLWAVDINKESLSVAEKDGIITEGFIEPHVPLKESDIVIISLYPHLTTRFIKDNIEFFKKNCIITDTSGVKEKIVEEINDFIREDLDFIGGHPMAGKEGSGFNIASEKIFEGANYIITPSKRNLSENVEKLRELIFKIGFKNIIEINPKEHDKVIAFTSHLPHIIASLLVNNSILDNHEFCVGGSFIDATRVAKINSELWSELLLSNSSNVVEQLISFEKDIDMMKNIILNNDKENLKKIFEKGKNRRELLV